jgi:hypothetical protein
MGRTSIPARWEELQSSNGRNEGVSWRECGWWQLELAKRQITDDIDCFQAKCNESHANIFRFIFINFFSLTFAWTGWFRKLPVLGRVTIFFAFQFKVFGRGRAKTS